MNEPPLTEDQAFAALDRVLARFADDRGVVRLKLRIRERGDNELDEVRQLAELARACRESPALAQALAAEGLGAIAELDLRTLVPSAGVLVQAFNRLVEERWEEE